MKKTITLLLLISAISTYSQNRYSTISTSTYTPMTRSEIMTLPMALQAKYNENQKYLYHLKNRVLELKTSIKEEPFLGRLKEVYGFLTFMEDKDLARATKSLYQSEVDINEIISEYKIENQNQIDIQNQNSTEVLYETSMKFDMPLRAKPEHTSAEIYSCPLNATVYVHDNKGKEYYRVTVNGHTGWISRHFLK